MGFGMNNKGQTSYQIFVEILERKRRSSRLLQAVAGMIWRQNSVWQMAE
jgi:hypothetical protein